MAIGALAVVSLCFLVLGGAYLVGSFFLPMGTMAHPGAGFYPLLVGIALICLSLPLLAQSLKTKEMGQKGEEAFPKGEDLHRVVAVALALIFFAVFLKPLGYGICSAVLMIAVLRFLGMRNWKKTVLISILSMAISYYLFAFILDAPLPRGILFS
ncbi:MAG: tripartite tricarboxylate transporter TctB family protein [Deltaproteobacteria bacterium]|nr:tripartite tricarboxylate transporter TctB family protein [Deltaproteobacteria bacterium]